MVDFAIPLLWGRLVHGEIATNSKYCVNSYRNVKSSVQTNAWSIKGLSGKE